MANKMKSQQTSDAVAVATPTPAATVNTYAAYDGSWKTNPSSPVPPVLSVNAKPGYTWVSLSWVPPVGGLTGDLAGYVVCRSTWKEGSLPPQTLADTGASVVYVGTGTYFGDRPLEDGSADIITADMGLQPGTQYYYSVFVVTTIPPTTGATSGYISTPVSILVETAGTPSTNLIETYGHPGFDTVLVDTANLYVFSGTNGSIIQTDGTVAPSATQNWQVVSVGALGEGLTIANGLPTVEYFTETTQGYQGDLFNPQTEYLRIKTAPLGIASDPNSAPSPASLVVAHVYQTIDLGTELIPGTLYSRLCFLIPKKF